MSEQNQNPSLCIVETCKRTPVLNASYCSVHILSIYKENPKDVCVCSILSETQCVHCLGNVLL
jgi:hypothetical protein